MKLIKEAIIERYTSKKSLDTPVEKELLLELLADASHAPYHKNEPWLAKLITTDEEKDYLYNEIISFYKETGLIKDEDSEEKLTTKMNRLIRQAPATILFAYETIPNNHRLDCDGIQATAALIQNFSLLLDEHDLVGFWASSPFVMSETFSERIGLPKGFKLIANYRIGYRDPELPIRARNRRPVSQWATSLKEKTGPSLLDK